MRNALRAISGAAQFALFLIGFRRRDEFDWEGRSKIGPSPGGRRVYSWTFNVADRGPGPNGYAPAGTTNYTSDIGVLGNAQGTGTGDLRALFTC